MTFQEEGFSGRGVLLNKFFTVHVAQGKATHMTAPEAQQYIQLWCKHY